MELFLFYSDQTLEKFDNLFLANSELAIKTLMFIRDPTKGIGNKKLAVSILSFYKNVLPYTKYLEILTQYSNLYVWKDYLEIFEATYENSCKNNYYPEIDLLCDVFRSDFLIYETNPEKVSTVCYYIPRQGGKYCKKYDIYRYVRDKLNLTNREYRHWITEFKKNVRKNSNQSIGDIYDKFLSMKSVFIENRLLNFYYDNCYYFDNFKNKNIISLSNTSTSQIISNFISYYTESPILYNNFYTISGTNKISLIKSIIQDNNKCNFSYDIQKNDLIFVDFIDTNIYEYILDRLVADTDYKCIIWKCVPNLEDTYELTGIEKNVFLINSLNPVINFNFNKTLLENLFNKIDKY